jgi:hypothetical protein
MLPEVYGGRRYEKSSVSNGINCSNIVWKLMKEVVIQDLIEQKKTLKNYGM